ncbi:hypothetical protein ACS0TY_029744 [Phlomoides rotata]
MMFTYLQIFNHPRAGHQDSVSSLSFSVDGQLAASGSLDGVIKIWDIAKGDLKCTLEGPNGGIEVAVERTRDLGWFRGFLNLDVECGHGFLPQCFYRPWW